MEVNPLDLVSLLCGNKSKFADAMKYQAEL